MWWRPGVSISPGLESVPGRDGRTDRIPIANTRSQHLPVQLWRVKMQCPATTNVLLLKSSIFISKQRLTLRTSDLTCMLPVCLHMSVNFFRKMAWAGTRASWIFIFFILSFKIIFFVQFYYFCTLLFFVSVQIFYHLYFSFFILFLLI